MRIISGTHKGRKINPPGGLPVRPTTDLAKESLFNILVNRIDYEESSVLDLFAGTGSITLEFASRGAKDVVSVDINYRCSEFIRSAAGSMGFKQVYVVKANVFQYLRSVKRQFDLIFADPPYDLKEVETIPDLVFGQALLKPGGWLVIEHDDSHSFSGVTFFEEERKYGKVHFSFFRYPEE